MDRLRKFGTNTHTYNMMVFLGETCFLGCFAGSMCVSVWLHPFESQMREVFFMVNFQHLFPRQASDNQTTWEKCKNNPDALLQMKIDASRFCSPKSCVCLCAHRSNNKKRSGIEKATHTTEAAAEAAPTAPNI